MRSSWKKNDPGYPTRVLGIVLVDGIEVHKCHTADEEQGIAICFATNPDGSVALNAKRDDTMDVIHRGVVKIIPTDSHD